MLPSPPSDPRPVSPVAILADVLARLAARVSELDDDASRVLLAHACELASGLDPYLALVTTPESPALARLTDQTNRGEWQTSGRSMQLEREMLSGHVEGQLLKMLVHVARASNVLDIGLFTGYSALAMAEALPPDGRVVACEIDAEVADFARRAFNETIDGRKVEVRVGPAAMTLGDLAAADEVFDIIFIDADKAGYWGYLNAILDGNLLAAHGLICVDNTLMQGQPWTTGASTANGIAVARFNEAVAADTRIEQVVLPVRDGLTLIRRVTASDGQGERGAQYA